MNREKSFVIEGKKKCNKCGEIKDISEFYLVSKNNPIPRSECKSCYLIISKERKKVYRGVHKNKERELEYNRNYYHIKGKFNRKRTEKTKEWEREYRKKRQKEDKKFVVEHRLRARINSIVRKGDMRKGRKSMDYLGCSSSEFIKYLESLFLEGMSWENKNLWHIDHIKPVCSFNLLNEEEILECFHYSNLRPLWKEDNRKKGIKDRKFTINTKSKYYEINNL